MNGGRNEDAEKRTTEGEIKAQAFFAKQKKTMRKIICLSSVWWQLRRYVGNMQHESTQCLSQPCKGLLRYFRNKF